MPYSVTLQLAYITLAYVFELSQAILVLPTDYTLKILTDRDNGKHLLRCGAVMQICTCKFEDQLGTWITYLMMKIITYYT